MRVVRREMLLRNAPSWLDEDAEQEGRIALWKAMRRFDPSRGVPFRRWAWRRMRGAARDLIRSEIRRLSGRDPRRVKGEYLIPIRLDVLRQHPVIKPEPALFEVEEELRLGLFLCARRERQAMNLYLAHGTAEAAKVLGCGQECVRTLVNNARHKMKGREFWNETWRRSRSKRCPARELASRPA